MKESKRRTSSPPLSRVWVSVVCRDTEQHATGFIRLKQDCFVSNKLNSRPKRPKITVELKNWRKMKLFDDFWATLPITLWNHNKKQIENRNQRSSNWRSTLAEELNNFLVEKVKKLVAEIKRSNTTFKLKRVNEIQDVFKISKELKAKKSYGQDV